ncbi:hypothetical protein EV1_000619 [Malus domestica]
MEYAFRFKFKASNYEAEYEALLASLRLAKHFGVKRIDIFSDSQLVVNQVTNNLDVNDSFMAAYLAQTQLLLKHFYYQITQVPRTVNSHVGALARLTSAMEDKFGRKIQVKLLAAPSTMAAEIRYKSTRYLIINDQLYKRGFNQPYLRCLTLTEVEIILRKYMKESVEIMQDLDPSHTRLFAKDITGQHSTKMPSEYPAHVINVKAT